MRLNVSSYLDILSKKGLSPEYVQKSTGLSEKTYLWILQNGLLEYSTLELIADAISCTPADIALPDYMGYSENMIEWVRDQDRATLSLSQRRTISRVKNLAEKYPEECQIVAENEDGSICAHIPVHWIRINPGMKLTDEQREERSERMRRNLQDNN